MRKNIKVYIYLFSGQIDWFAKRGINWHISVCLYKSGSCYSTITYVHIFESPVSQDAALTAEILIDISKSLLQQRAEIKEIHFVSDNAGCYKSATSLLMMYQQLKYRILTYNFCEAQNGKGIF